MRINLLPTGINPPSDLNVVVEVPMGDNPVKYEMDKASGSLYVDRFLHTSMHYPCNYGFVPHTLSGDGDPIDVLVVTNYPIQAGAILRSRPVGVLLMEDEAGMDEKILAVPVSELHPFYDNIYEYSDLPDILLKQISHFFAHYKDLEDGKFVKIIGWENTAKAEAIILDAIAAYKKDYPDGDIE